jgi:hypothetical protein
MKRTDQLPPKPDPQTGQPRPPAAPLVESMGKEPERSRETNTKRKPKPPEGRGPVLEWYQPRSGPILISAVVVALGIVALAALQNWTMQGLLAWYVWPWPIAFVVIIYFKFRRRVIAAGADWYFDGKHWVDTYDLKQVKVNTGPGRLDLVLRDRSGRVTVTTCLVIEANRQLWDLVYNGVVNSAQDHHVETNDVARQYLHLPW